jgi:nitroreductase / dihydropteridine reductase
MSWRYATKKMNTSSPVPPERVEAIIEAVRMAPTSSGLQHGITTPLSELMKLFK